MLSNAIKNKELASEEEWSSYIGSLKAAGKPEKDGLKEALVLAVEKRIPKKRFGILFSGGVDSSFIALLCSRAKADFACYAVGLEGSADIESAKRAAKLMKLDLKAKILTMKEAESAIKKVTEIVGPDVMKVGVGAVIYEAAKLAKKDGIEIVFSGLGSEEVFAGYERHVKSKDINDECWNGLKAMHQRDFTRDYAIAEELGAEIMTPFLDKDVIIQGMQVPAHKKIKGSNKKLILREIAEEMGLPKEIAWRQKKAAQYGSRIQKAMKSLASNAGFNRITEYLMQFYKPRNMKLGALVSSGKDSIYAMYTMMKRNYEIGCMITMKSINPDSYMFHSAAVEMAALQAKAAGIPIIEVETKGEKEEELADLKNALEMAQKQHGIKGIVSGALYSSYQKERVDRIAESLELKSFAPLWHIDQEKLLKDIISTGFEFMLTKIAAEGLDKSWLNREITEKDVDRLVLLNKKVGLNIAFEGGEAESLMVSGPIFKKRIKIIESEIDEESPILATLKIKKAELV